MLQVLADRHTCRSFDPAKPIPRAVLEQILAAGLSTPTGKNAQSFDFYVVTRESSLSALAASAFTGLPDEFKSTVGAPEKLFYGARALIVLASARQTTFCSKYDIGLISESISVAATALGLGSVILGVVRYAQAEALKEAVAPSVEAVPLAVGIGYPSEKWARKPRELVTPIKYVE
jgi:nitroreductase